MAHGARIARAILFLETSWYVPRSGIIERNNRQQKQHILFWIRTNSTFNTLYLMFERPKSTLTPLEPAVEHLSRHRALTLCRGRTLGTSLVWELRHDWNTGTAAWTMRNHVQPTFTTFNNQAVGSHSPRIHYTRCRNVDIVESFVLVFNVIKNVQNVNVTK